MPTQGIAHKNLTDPQLHELKGASTAEANTVPFADGEGHSSWKKVTINLVEKTTTNGGVKPLVPLFVLSPIYDGGLQATTDGQIMDAISFAQTNKNIKELVNELNSVITAYEALRKDYLNLEKQYNQIATALQANGFINGVVDV